MSFKDTPVGKTVELMLAAYEVAKFTATQIKPDPDTLIDFSVETEQEAGFYILGMFHTLYITDPKEEFDDTDKAYYFALLENVKKAYEVIKND